MELLMSPRLIGELVEVLDRPKFAQQSAAGRAGAYVAALVAGAVVVPDPAEASRPCRESDDDYLLALAVASAADVIVSGDRDLLELADPPVPVSTPRAFLDRLEAAGDG
ncbi:hypothetical protein BH20ACT5_BH20ACT5_24820 [soil metagenome]